MKLPRLLRTSAVRLALRSALFHVVLMAAGLIMLYLTASRFVDTQIAAGLQQTLQALAHTREEQGTTALQALLLARQQSSDIDPLHALYLDPIGTPLAGNLAHWPADLPVDGKVHNVMIADEEFWPAIAMGFPDGSRLLVTHPIAEAEELLDVLQGTIAVILIVTLALSLGIGLLQGRALLARIDVLIATARAIGSGKLGRRIPRTGRDDELDELAEQLNAMLGRIEALLEGMRQVTDNVAHDLRRPLSRVRNLLEVTLLEAHSGAEYDRILRRAISDLDELIQTFNALLEIAQTESGSFRGDWAQVDLSALARELGELYGDLAEEQGRTLELALTPGLSVSGNRHLLAQALSNLLDNAFKFTPAQASVTLELMRHEGQVRLCIIDHGSGIPVTEREHVLERFVRLDAARSTAGNGLGLSLVAAVARLHRACLTLTDAAPGLRACLQFPPDTGQ